MSHRAAGFTLLELLIAVAVFAVVATTVYTRSGDTLSQLQMLEERTVATWIAQNELAAARIRQRIEDEPMRLGTNSKELVMGGRDWTVSVQVLSTTHPWLRRMEVAVQPSLERDAARYELVGYVGRY